MVNQFIGYKQKGRSTKKHPISWYYFKLLLVFHRIINQNLIQTAPILVFVNKQDLLSDMSVEEIKERFGCIQRIELEIKTLKSLRNYTLLYLLLLN